MSTPIRFGFIGAGQIAYYSVPLVRSHGEGEVVAVADASGERARELSVKREVANVCGSAEELLAREDVDAVYIAVPNKFHAALSIEAMRAGKHVLLEKPFAMNHAEAAEVIRVSEETGRVFSLGMNYRMGENVQRSRAVVETGMLGEIYHAKAYWYRRSGIPRLGTWFGDKALAGGGCLYDIGVHYLDMCMFLMGEFKPVSVSGVTYTKFGNRGQGEGGWGLSDRGDGCFNVDDLASALIRLESGATITLDISWAAYIECENMNDIRLFGTEAGMLSDPCQVFRRHPKTGEFETLADFSHLPIRFPHCNRFHNMINHLRGREPLSTSHAEALAVQRILDGVAESAESGRDVMV